jgi:hypothetical protein
MTGTTRPLGAATAMPTFALRCRRIFPSTKCAFSGGCRTSADATTHRPMISTSRLFPVPAAGAGDFGSAGASEVAAAARSAGEHYAFILSRLLQSNSTP